MTSLVDMADRDKQMVLPVTLRSHPEVDRWSSPPVWVYGFPALPTGVSLKSGRPGRRGDWLFLASTGSPGIRRSNGCGAFTRRPLRRGRELTPDRFGAQPISCNAEPVPGPTGVGGSPGPTGPGRSPLRMSRPLLSSSRQCRSRRVQAVPQVDRSRGEEVAAKSRGSCEVVGLVAGRVRSGFLRCKKVLLGQKEGSGFHITRERSSKR